MILTLQTTTFGVYGGIPTYNRLVCRVLNENREVEKRYVLIATDKASDIERVSHELPNLKLQAFNQNRAAFTCRLVKLALTHKFDLALIGHVNYAPLGLMLKRFQPQLRYGVMLYGIEAWQQLPRLKRHALQNADFLISISDYTKQKAVEANSLDADRVYLLPNALEWVGQEQSAKSEAATAESESQTANKGIELLSVCRLDRSEQYKGVDKVIEALSEVAKKVPQVHYTVVGGGTDLPRHQALAEKLGVSERVHFSGVLGDEALRDCYRNCDVFVMPSAGEGFGFVFLEAMKYDKPIVAANSGGAPEVVQDGITGKLVEYGNEEQLAKAVIDLCLDPNMRQRLGQAGHQRLQEKFTFSQFRQKLTEILLRELPAKAAYKFPSTDESTSCAS